MADKIFTKGLVVKVPENKPDFVIARLGIKVDEFMDFLEANVKNNGWVDIDLLMGRENKPYGALNTYKPEKPGVVEQPQDESTEEPPF